MCNCAPLLKKPMLKSDYLFCKMIIFKGVLNFFLYYTTPLPNNNDNPVDRTQHTHTQVNILKAIKPTSWVPSSHSLFVIWYATKER